MRNPGFTTRQVLGFCLFSTILASSVATAQGPKSGPLAQELAKLLEAGKLEAIAARHATEPDRFMAALYFPGQLLIVSAKYAAPPLLTEQLQKKNYRDIYIDLNGASVPESKVFISDVGADGLMIERQSGSDSYERGAKVNWVFNGQWRQQKIASEAEYKKHYEAADAEYVEILTALIQQAKKPS